MGDHGHRALLSALVCASIACAEPTVTDGGSPDAASVCRSDLDCSDGTFCNGVEVCSPDDPDADPLGCLPSEGSPCTEGQTCDEALDRCTTTCRVTEDADGDGSLARECDGDDCDDADPLRHPGATEICDDADRDEDCDPDTYGSVDGDIDGHDDARCCNGAVCGDDCDDARADVYRGLIESCDGRDNDCDADTDEGVLLAFRRDADGDGFASPTGEIAMACAAPSGYAAMATDCRDDDSGIHPGVDEDCGPVDRDCDTRTDESGTGTFYRDADGDSHGTSGLIMTLPTCTPPDGYVSIGDDCDDAVATTYLGASELCNRVDDDCSGAPSAGEDADVDGFLGAASTCAGGPLAALPRADCDDTSASVSPSASERCNGANDDCDGAIDESPTAATCPSIQNASPVCVSSACDYGSCDGGFADCNTVRADGCEVALATSAAHCGMCGRACRAGVTCGAGACDDALAVVSGSFHACALLRSRRVACWGQNSVSQLGSTGGSRDAPVIVAGLTDVIAVAAGASHTCAIVAPGSVVCWGHNVAGQLGVGMTTVGSASPLPVPGISDATQIAAGTSHTCVLRAGGAVSCWGDGSFGQNGDSGFAVRYTPAPVTVPAGATQIDAGGSQTCVRTSAGAIHCWGRNNLGQLGRGSTSCCDASPAAVTGVADASAVSVGTTHACAIRSGGTVSCWGANDSGQCGDSTTTTPRTTPVPVTGLTMAITIDAGASDACAVRTGGQAMCWGANGSGQLGDGTTTSPRTSPVAVAGAGVWTGAACGAASCCFARSGGGVACAGSDSDGQLGNGASGPSSVPADVLGI